ncbi:hypothetical protein CR513_62376, partial [Mucuna pruriens]
MFTGYLLGYAAFRALFNHSPAMNAAGGILGLMPTKQENPVRNRDHPFQHPRLRKTSRHD